jgi:fucose permease
MPRMSIMGVCNKFAGIVSPLIFAAFILKASDKALFEALPTMSEVAKNVALDELTRRMMIPYACLSVILLSAGLFIRRSVLPEINTEDESKEVAAAHGGKTSVFQFPYLVLGVLAIFTHVGTQIISIDTIIGYGRSMGLDLLDAKVFPSFTLTATITGYLLGIFCIPRFISQTNALRVCTITGMIFACCILFMPGHIMFKGHEISASIWFIVLLGLPNALVYAGIWPLAIRDLGRFTKTGSSLLIMALCGNALFPLIYGHFADSIGTRAAYWVLIPCYLYLIFYAVYGHKITSWRIQKKMKDEI